LNPRTGTWSMIRDWRDKSWINIAELSNGLDENLHQQRLTLFGPNLIEIVAKSTISLLVDEVSHVGGTSDRVLTGYLSDYPRLLCLPDCQYHPMVHRRLLLLCLLYCCHISVQHHLDLDRNQKSALSGVMRGHGSYYSRL
jgi:hypothetical protein